MIEAYIIKSLEFWNVPGASVAIVKDNEVILAKGFGYTKLEKVKSHEVNADTLFPIASLTKSFSAVATGVFVEQQHISLDSTIDSLWPSFKLSDTYATRHLTLLDCLSMRAGLTGPLPENVWWLQSHLSEEALIHELSKLSFPCGFRGCFAYQNLLYNIVGHTIEKTTGKSWEKFVREYVLDMLEMNATTTHYSAFLAFQNKAFPHQREGSRIQEVPFEKLDVIAPGAGLSSNANDMAKWLQFLLKEQNSFIVRNMLTPQVVVQPESFFSEEETQVFLPHSHFLAYGLGWFIHDYKGIIICQAPGLTDGMNSLIALIPELNLGIVILNNLEAPFFSHSVLFHIIDHYRGEFNDWDRLFLFENND